VTLLDEPDISLAKRVIDEADARPWRVVGTETLTSRVHRVSLRRDADTATRTVVIKRMKPDDAKRSVFLARFGEPNSSKDVYVTLNDLCGPGKSLF